MPGAAIGRRGHHAPNPFSAANRSRWFPARKTRRQIPDLYTQFPSPAPSVRRAKGSIAKIVRAGRTKILILTP
jgi:hypothetical protein